MKTTFYLLILCLTGLLTPTTTLGVCGYPVNPLVAYFTPAPPVEIAVNLPGIDVLFYNELGTVEITLAAVEGKFASSQSIDTSVQTHATIDASGLPAGTYMLTVTADNGVVLAAKNIIIP